MYRIIVLAITIFSSLSLSATEFLLDTGVGINKASGIGVSGNSASPLNFMIGGRAKLYSASGKYFYAPGMRLSYYVLNRSFLDTNISLRSNGMVYEQWSLTSIDSLFEFGRKVNRYEFSMLATVGIGSFSYDGVLNNPAQLARTRDTGLGFSIGIANGMEITKRLSARLELGYRWYYLLNPNNINMLTGLISIQYTL